VSLTFIADHDVWPLTSGLAQRLYHLSTGLARKTTVDLVIMSPSSMSVPFPGRDLFRSVTVVPYSSCRFATDEDPDHVESPMRRLARTRSTIPWAVRRFESPVLRCVLRPLVESCDIDAVWATRGHFAAQASAHRRIPIIVDMPDLESEQQRRAGHDRRSVELARWIELALLVRWERSLPTRFSAVAVCREDDRRRLRRGVVEVVRNGVAAVDAHDPTGERSDEVLFVGNLEYAPNVDAVITFARDVLPRIQRRRPSTRFVVVGRNPSADVRRLDDGNRCIVYADAPSLTEFYERAALVVVPMRMGSGTRIKVLEAMAHGKALVSTSLGLEGLSVRPGVDVSCAEVPDDFATACVGLLADPDRRREMGAAARRAVTSSYDWSVAVEEAWQIVRRVSLCSHD